MKTTYHLRYEKLYKSLHNEGIKVFQEKFQKQTQIIFYVCESKIINVFTNCYKNILRSLLSNKKDVGRKTK